MTDNGNESEGEEYIKDYFESHVIKYERNADLSRLKINPKCYKTADFYLPEYRIYVEYFGDWNKPTSLEYDQGLKNVYRDNKIPCIYLYPNNIGMLDFLFKKRMVERLKNYEYNWELLKFRFNRSLDDKWNLILFTAFFGYQLYNAWNSNPRSYKVIIIMTMFTLIVVVQILKGYYFMVFEYISSRFHHKG